MELAEDQRGDFVVGLTERRRLVYTTGD